MRVFTSLQAKLILAFVAVVGVALLLAGGAFILVKRNDQRQHELDRIAAAAPAVFGEFQGFAARGEKPDTFAQFVQATAERHGVRVLLISSDSRVTADSDTNLVGQKVAIPPDATKVTAPFGRGSYTTWEPAGNSPGSGLVMVTSSLPIFEIDGKQGALPVKPVVGGQIVLAAPVSTLAHAWVSLLPGLGIAAGIALPVAVLLGLLLAQYITRPVKDLTFASQQMAEGRFDVHVPTGRRDELGDLAEAFATMARKVGGSQAQMRMLVANVSHDLKTPLTSILGFAQALNTGAAPTEDAARIGGIIEEEANRLATRLNELLYLSEIDAGATVVAAEAVELSRLTTAAVERLLPASTARQFTLSTAITTDVIAIADAAKTERIVENLLDNARKFVTAGGDVSIKTYVAGTNAVVEVGNSCDDIAPDELSRLFDRFYRRDRTRNRKMQGSGLGLSIARDIARLQGGELTAAAGPGRVTFRLSLPNGGESATRAPGPSSVPAAVPRVG
ncbi:MAG: HAMP domain-containing sensor histidine kinase [Tepidiformaceae bacterium]